LYVAAVLLFAFVIGTAKDAFRIRDELRLVAASWLVCTVLWVVFTYGNVSDICSYYLPGFFFVELAYISSFVFSTMWVWWLALQDSKKKDSEAPSSALRLAQLLEDSKFKKDFANFLCLQLCIENLHFWEAVQKYRYVGENEAHKEGKTIYEKYIESGGPYEIAVPSKVKKVIEKSVAEACYAPTLFDDACTYILDLMETDSLPRFLSKQGNQKYVGVA